MKPFQHLNARTLEEAVSAAGKKAMLIAGGTDCLSVLKNGVLPACPEVLVNIKTIPGLASIEESGAGLRIGALATLAEVAASPVVRKKYKIVAEAAGSVASPQIRNMGTIGGNLCQDTRCWYYRCSPFTGRSYHCRRKGGSTCFAVAGDNRYHAVLGGKRCFAVCPSDTAVALAALDAMLTITGPAGERTIPLGDFFTVRGNILKPHEILTEVRIPPPPREARQTFLKFRIRNAIDFAIVSAASVVTMEDGTCLGARIALGAVAPTPVRAREAERAMSGKPLNNTMVKDAAEVAVAGAKPLAMNAYKIEIAKTLVKRVLLA